MSNRYKVLIGDNITGTFKEYLRVVPQNARRQERGLGAATFMLLNKQGPITDGRQGYESTDEIVKGQFIKIIDTQIGDEPTGTIWFGYITDIIRELYKGGNDFRGAIYADEIGHYYAQIPITSVYRTGASKYINTPPDFNQKRDEYFYANKQPNTNYFKVNNVTFANASKWTTDTNEAERWCRADVLGLLMGDAPSCGISLPEDNLFLYDKSKAESYPSFYGRNIIDMLDTMLPEPLSYYFDYWSSLGGIDVIVYSKSKTAVANIPQAEALNIDTTGDTSLVDVTVTSTQQQVDQVIVRGNRIVVAGSLTALPNSNGNTLMPDWEEGELDEFIQGVPNDQPGSDNVLSLPEGAVISFRNDYPNVYNKFRFHHRSDIEPKVLITEDPARQTNAVQSYKPFFPVFTYVDENGLPIDTPTVSTEISDGHTTPVTQSTNFVNFLPIYKRNELYIPGGDSIDKVTDELYEPQYWCFGRSPKQLGGYSYYWLNILSPSSSFRGKFEYKPNGFVIKTPLREFSAYDDLSNNLWLSSDGNTNFRPASPTFVVPNENYVGFKNLTVYGEWREEDRDIPPGPTSLIEAPFKYHWLRSIATVAMESDQRLEVTRGRKILVGVDTGAPGFIDAPARVKRIFDVDYSIWYVHKGTVYDTNGVNDNNFNILKTFNEGTITRNDLPLANRLADIAWNWLTTVRSSLSLEFQLNSFDTSKNTWNQIGNYIERYKDNKGPGPNQVASEWQINSSISSIEYIFGSTPRLIVNTEIPAEPLFTQLMGGTK